jgi:adenine-specific DNA methylase
MTNDVQHYSYTISKSIIENDTIFPKKAFLEKLINNSEKQKIYTFFQKNYSNTYFTEKVCKQIDNISLQIDKLS